jgi:hypothetical protein
MTTKKQIEFWEYGPGRLFNPYFWEHPTPMNLFLILLGIGAMIFVLVWSAWIAMNILPWPTF